MRRSTAAPGAHDRRPPSSQSGTGSGGNLYLFTMLWRYLKRCRRRCSRRNKRKKNRAAFARMAMENRKSIAGTDGRTRKIEKVGRGYKMSSFDTMTGGNRGYLSGGDTNTNRLFAVRVTMTAQGGSIRNAVKSTIELKRYVSELHVVVPYSMRGDREAREKNPLRGLYNKWAKDQKDLADAGIRTVLHPRRFAEREMGSHIRRLVHMAATCAMTCDVFEELIEEQIVPRFRKDKYRHMIYSIRTITYEAGFSIWTPMIVAILVFDWWRSLLAQWFRTKSPRDVIIFPVLHDDVGPYVPSESRPLSFMIPGLGIIWERARPLCPKTGASNYLPKGWSGWDRVVWLAQHMDFVGIGGIVGWLLLIWFFSLPWWNLFIKFLAVEAVTEIRIGAWAIHTVIMALILPKTYKGPLQNLTLAFGFPLMITPMMIILLYARYGVSHPGIMRHVRHYGDDEDEEDDKRD